MLQAQFPKEALAYLRSDGRAQALLDKHVKSGSPQWQEEYVRDVLVNA
jgi:type IV secretion system protein VirB4